MAETKTLLILRLEGPLQSWGENAKWDFRDSASLPTKSGIVGLIGCAMGFERGSKELVELNQALTVAVRADRLGTKTIDFQTVTGHPLLDASGQKKNDSGTIVSKRVYLQDACFTVFVETDPEWHTRITDALQSPKWNVFLGRKNCVPSRNVLECADPDYENMMDAIYQYPVAQRAEYPMVFETEKDIKDKPATLRPDNLIGSNREFEMRKVWRGVIEEELHVSD